MSALTGAQLGLMTGSFLSGCLLSIPLLTIPTIISPSSSPTAPILLSSWSTLYHHGALTMPPLAFLTASLYGLSAYKLRSSSSSSSSSSSPRTQKQTQTQTQQRKNEKCSKLFAIAAIATLAIGPLTLLVMSPTNKELMRLNEIQIEPGPLVSDVEEVRELVRKWNWLHVVRSLGPVVGCVVGWFGVFGYGDEEKGEEKVEGEKQ